MREFGSFLVWLFALTGSVLALNLALGLLPLPGDIAVVAACLPLVGAFALMERGGGERPARKVLAYWTWFLGGFLAIALTAFALTRIT